MYIVLVIILLIASLAGYIAMRPSEFNVKRTAMIYAPASTVFEQVNDLQLWQAWSPWAKIDPNAKISFSGAAKGVGASMRWVSNSKKVGEGSMTITESHTNEFIKIALEFVEPFKGENTTEFTFRPNGNHTVVAWSNYGTNNFMAKAIGLVFNCEEMMGKQFQQGLKNLKAVAEAAPKR